MDDASLTRRIEQELEQAGILAIVEETDGAILLSGRVNSAGERQTAEDIVAGLAPDRRIDNDLEVETTLPRDLDDLYSDQPDMDELTETVGEIRASGGEIEPDFTNQRLNVDVMNVTEDTDISGRPNTDAVNADDADQVFFPPTDPVIRIDERGDAEFLGGFTPDSMTEVEVDRSALDGRPGDEALIDAIKRELREDALTTDLEIDVLVRDGVVRLRGTVADLEDAENAEEVAARVPGVREVIEELTVVNL